MPYQVGQSYEMKKEITECEVLMFAGLSGDLNPVHINEDYAQGTIFQRRIAHGALVNAYISAVLGMHMPGLGTIYLSQESHYRKPACLGDVLTIRVEIKDINEKGRAHIETRAVNQNGELVVDGMAYVVLPREQEA